MMLTTVHPFLRLYPVLRAINKYKNQHRICNKKKNAGNSTMDKKNPTGIKERDTSV